MFERVEYTVETNVPEKEELLQIVKGDHTLKQILKIVGDSEIVVVSSELIQTFLFEQNWQDLESIRSPTISKHLLFQKFSSSLCEKKA
jgi:predicted polyphosphate/ATP-dependent NAD kinase